MAEPKPGMSWIGLISFETSEEFRGQKDQEWARIPGAKIDQDFGQGRWGMVAQRVGDARRDNSIGKSIEVEINVLMSRRLE